jgi:hypothetical protein
MLRRLLCCQQEKRRITSSPLHLTQQPPRPRRCAQSGPVPRQDHHERAGTARHCRRAAPATPWSCSREAVHKKSTSFPRPTAAPKLAPCSKAAQPLDGPSLGPTGHPATASRPQRPPGDAQRVLEVAAPNSFWGESRNLPLRCQQSAVDERCVARTKRLSSTLRALERSTVATRKGALCQFLCHFIL